MNRMSTAKEALIAEALGDMDLLLKRLEAVVPLVDGTRKTLIKSADMVSREIAGFAPHMKEFTDYAKIQTAKQIDRSVTDVTQRAKEMQVQAMREAGSGTGHFQEGIPSNGESSDRSAGAPRSPGPAPPQPLDAVVDARRGVRDRRCADLAGGCDELGSVRSDISNWAIRNRRPLS